MGRLVKQKDFVDMVGKTDIISVVVPPANTAALLLGEVAVSSGLPGLLLELDTLGSSFRAWWLTQVAIGCFLLICLSVYFCEFLRTGEDFEDTITPVVSSAAQAFKTGLTLSSLSLPSLVSLCRIEYWWI